jgi:hypothetical protein
MQEVQVTQDQVADLVESARTVVRIASDAHDLIQRQYDEGRVSAATLRRVNDAVIESANAALPFVDVARNTTHAPDLRAAVSALLIIFDRLVLALSDAGAAPNLLTRSLSVLRAFIGADTWKN